MRAWPWCLSAVLLVSSWGERAAWSQTDEERAAARAAAQQGITAWKEGRYTAAVDFLTRAEAVVHAPPHLLYIARAYKDSGKLVKAREAYLRLTKEQLPANAPKAFADAKADGSKELAQLEPRLAYVKIAIEGPSAANVRVLMDDAAVPPSLVEIERPTDPGTHKFQALGDGVESEVASMNFEEGTRRTITLTLHATAGAAAPATAPARAPVPERATLEKTDAAAAGREPTMQVSDAPAPSPGHGLRVLSFVMFGAGAVAIGTGSYFQNLRMRREEVSTDAFNDCNPRYCNREEINAILELDARANAAQRSANIAFAVGGASVALGVTLLIMDIHSSSRASAPAGRVAVKPWISPNGAGLYGTF